MNKEETDLSDIFAAMEEINNLDEIRKNKKLKNYIDQQRSNRKEERQNTNERVPSKTEDIIKQAEKYLRPINKK
tara:strand:- start:124 stop:345 length:222 start_codon:yes stop_codon:yes gene_type:complete